MPTQEEKICPLFRAAKGLTIGDTSYCLKEKCGFWNPDGNACSLEVIAKSLQFIAGKKY
jgi:hypothetical protein